MTMAETQESRLDYLVEQFKKDSVRYENLEVPEDRESKERILRSLMNIRMPKTLPTDVLKVQDDYLRELSYERGIVEAEDIPEAADKMAIWQGDITRLKCDAIVNAANSQMLGCFVPMHLCIDNCIHTFAGVQMRAECARQMEELRAKFGSEYEQPTAVPMLTDAYNLPSDKVIHIVGPIVDGELKSVHEELLAKCYSRTLELCVENGIKTVAFCCISTGVFRFPAKRAAEIATETVKSWLKEHSDSVERVIFNVFNDKDRRIYEELICR